MNRLTPFLASLLVVFGGLAFVPSANACPGCQAAIEAEAAESDAADDADDPFFNPSYAYSYSVLFMLAVPALILTGFGTAWYRLARQAKLGGTASPINSDQPQP